MAQKEQHHERISTFLVASDRAQASQNEIRVALESNDDEAKVVAMQKAITALLNGEQLPQLFITIVRYVLPSENHMVQKLLLLYLVSVFLIFGRFSKLLRNGFISCRPLICAGNDREDGCFWQTTARNDINLSEFA